MLRKALIFSCRILIIVSALSICASARDGRRPPLAYQPIHGKPLPSVVRRREPDPSIRLIAVGDIMLAGPMGKLMARRGRNFPFARMKPVFDQADIVFGNVECCIATIGSKVPKKYNFRADPHMAPALKEAGFGIVSLANNHSWDYGREALEDTVRNVRATGVRTVGAGANRQEAHQLQIIECKGKRIGFLAYLGLLPALVPESDTEPCLSLASVEAIRNDVEQARPEVDILVVSLHGGKEGHPLPTPFQKLLAYTAIDAGADMVIGHHPHVPQPLVRYKGKYIAYSLGNFVFSTTGRGGGVMLDARIRPDNTIRACVLPLSLRDAPPRLLSDTAASQLR